MTGKIKIASLFVLKTTCQASVLDFFTKDTKLESLLATEKVENDKIEQKLEAKISHTQPKRINIFNQHDQISSKLFRPWEITKNQYAEMKENVLYPNPDLIKFYEKYPHFINHGQNIIPLEKYTKIIQNYTLFTHGDNIELKIFGKNLHDYSGKIKKNQYYDLKSLDNQDHLICQKGEYLELKFRAKNYIDEYKNYGGDRFVVRLINQENEFRTLTRVPNSYSTNKNPNMVVIPATVDDPDTGTYMVKLPCLNFLKESEINTLSTVLR